MTEPALSVTDPTLIQRALAGMGIDRAVGWTAAARVWSVLAGPISVLLIATRLSGEEQGFYYTFASIVSFQVLFELGLGFVVQQFASHEKAFLTWLPNGTLDGSEQAKRRLAALLRKTVQWYAVATALTAATLLIGGTIFFALQRTAVTGWQPPWIAVAVLAGATLFVTPFLSMLEGCGLVTDVARVRLAQAVASNLAGWTILLSGGRLWASPAISGMALLVAGTWVFLAHRTFFSDLLRTQGEGLSWREEVWPFQWRIAVSWISGYFMFHLFIPVLFAARGPAEAGRMGMSLALASAAYVVSNSLLTTKIPMFGELIARRAFAELDARFFPAMWSSLGVMAAGSVAILGGTFVLRAISSKWSDRLLDPLPFSLLLATFTISTIFFAETVYLRAHKQEPFLGIFVLSALATSASAILLGRTWGTTAMMAGYFVSTLLISVGGGTWIFLRKRSEWHR